RQTLDRAPVAVVRHALRRPHEPPLLTVSVLRVEPVAVRPPDARVLQLLREVRGDNDLDDPTLFAGLKFDGDVATVAEGFKLPDAVDRGEVALRHNGN